MLCPYFDRSRLFSGAVVKEVDTNALFEKYTIDEIREIEKKTRYVVMTPVAKQNGALVINDYINLY